MTSSAGMPDSGFVQGVRHHANLSQSDRDIGERFHSSLFELEDDRVTYPLKPTNRENSRQTNSEI